MNTLTIGKTVSIIDKGLNDDGQAICQITEAIIEVQVLDQSNMPYGSAALLVSFIDVDAETIVLRESIDAESIKQACITRLGSEYDLFVLKTISQFSYTETLIL